MKILHSSNEYIRPNIIIVIKIGHSLLKSTGLAKQKSATVYIIVGGDKDTDS